MTTNPPTPPSDATLSVTRAAYVLGVHPNTIRTWSEQGRLRYFRINPRGDRRYRMRDLQRFLSEAGRDSQTRIERAARREVAAAGSPVTVVAANAHAANIVEFPALLEAPPTVASPPDPAGITPVAATRTGRQKARPNEPGRSYSQLGDLATITRSGRDLDRTLQSAARLIRTATGASDVSIWERVDDNLVRRVADGRAGHPTQLPLPAVTAAAALSTGQAVVSSLGQRRDWPASASRDGVEAAVPIAGDGRPWGVLVVRHARPLDAERDELEWLGAAAALLAIAVYSAELLEASGR